jgi:hypothetical protein
LAWGRQENLLGQEKVEGGREAKVNRANSGALRRWLIILGIGLIVAAILLLGYALLPGSDVLRIQSTVSPTLFAAP